MGCGEGQKVLFRSSWYWICLLLQLKSQSARGVFHDPVFIVLGLIKGMRKGSESKIFFDYLKEVVVRWCNLVHVEYSSVLDFGRSLIRRGWIVNTTGCKLESYFGQYHHFPNRYLSCNFPKMIFKTPHLFLYSNFNRSFIYMQHCHIRVKMMYRSKFVASSFPNFPNVMSRVTSFSSI